MNDDVAFRSAVAIGAATVLAAIPSLAVALSLIASDAAEQGEWLDGVGFVLGFLLLGGTLLPVLCAAYCVWQSRRSTTTAFVLGGAGLVGALGLTLVTIPALLG